VSTAREAGLPSPIRQPGPAAGDRIVAVQATARRFSVELAAGSLLLEGIAQGFAAAGFASGIVVLPPLLLHPFRYVMPALSEEPGHAAYYSEIFSASDPTRIETGAMTFGVREGAPFFHAHALWDETGRGARGGHILPDGTYVAAPARVEAIGLSGAAFFAEPDAEINFTVFGPKAATADHATDGTRALAMRLRPNVDPFAAIAETAAAHGMSRARIWGGVGSTIGARFTDGEALDTLATEIFVRDGQIASSSGTDKVSLAIGLVDHLGHIRRSRLAPGRNRVLMTMELVLEMLD
jgi:predicted DNA-binding protein with PD1-like motif